MNTQVERNLYIIESDEREMWSNCIVIFDTSAILSLYEYTEVFRKKFIEGVLDKFNGRLFITGHSEFEYFKNREGKIDNPISQIIKPFKKGFLKGVDEKIKSIEDEVEERKLESGKEDNVRYLPSEMFSEIERIIKELKTASKNLINDVNVKLDEEIKEYDNLKKDDYVYAVLKERFNVGEQYSFSKILNLIRNEGEFRHRNLIPPGFRDNPNTSSSKKNGTQIYGDFIIWKQILELAVEKESNVLFVTNDLKDDWCDTVKGKPTRINNPHVDLSREFAEVTGKVIQMYSIPDILYFSNRYLKSEFTEEEIDVVDELTITDNLEIKLYSNNKTVIRCSRCDTINEYTPGDMMMDFESQGGTERQMGPENHYRSESFLTCNECSNTIVVEMNIYEYPIGAHNFQSEYTSGGTVIAMYDYVSEFWNERESEDYPYK